MTDFRTWWRYRDGKEMTVVLSIIAAVLLGVFATYEYEGEDPNICKNLCIVDKNGIPRYERWFKKHPEDLPDGIRG